MSNSDAKVSRPRARQSISYLPSADAIIDDKENATVDTSALQSQKKASRPVKKKSRSKSLGPGGLEALKESDGNAFRVRNTFLCQV